MKGPPLCAGCAFLKHTKNLPSGEARFEKIKPIHEPAGARQSRLFVLCGREIRKTIEIVFEGIQQYDQYGLPAE